MKGFPIFIVIILLVATASCSNVKQEKLAVDKNERQVLFFSDEEEHQHEAAYYDALIELKKDFPSEMKNLMVLSGHSEKEYFKEFNIESGPALIVIYKEKVIVRINGKASKDQIIKPVTTIFEASPKAP